MQRFFIASLALTSLILPSSALAAPRPDSGTGARALVNITEQTGLEIRGDFIVGPTRFTVEMDPGEERTVEVTLTSREGETRNYSLSNEDFSISDDGQDNVVFYGGGNGPFSARSWLSPLISTITLNSRERATIPVKISIPKNAAVGDHYTTVLFQRNPQASEAAGFQMISRIGVLFLITVKGDIIREGNLQQFLTEKHVYWSLPSRLIIQYRNSGTVNIVPNAHVEIRNIFGIPVDDIAIKDWYVLRNSTRRREINWQPKFALGYYSATLSMKGVGTGNDVQQTVSFWVIPTLPVLLALIAIFGVSFLVQVFFSRFELRRKKTS